MSCPKCESKLPCGCDDVSLKTPPPCETGTTACPNPDECPETFSAGCTIWTGQDIICNSSVVASEGMSLHQVIENMVALFCGPQTPPQDSISQLHPLPGVVLNDIAPVPICIDRNNCFEDVTIAFDATAPTGMNLLWDDIGGTPQSGPVATIDASISCLNIFIDKSGAMGAPGVYNFDLIVTGCGNSFLVPVTITLP